MRRLAVCLSVGSLLVVTATFAQERVRGDTEPPLLLVAEHDGQEIPLALDEPVTVGGATFTLRLRAHRALEARDFEVHYPRGYTFAHERADDQSTWTITGVASTLLAFVPDAPIDRKVYLSAHVEGMRAQFDDLRVTPVSLAFEGKPTQGQRLRFGTGDIEITQDTYVLELPGGRAMMVIVQEAIGEDLDPQEAAGLRDLVSKTFRRR